jgi:hypothetical protein
MAGAGAQQLGAAGAAAQGAGAAHVGAGAQHDGAGAQHDGAGAQHDGAQPQPHPPWWKNAFAEFTDEQQNNNAAETVSHFIVTSPRTPSLVGTNVRNSVSCQFRRIRIAWQGEFSSHRMANTTAISANRSFAGHVNCEEQIGPGELRRT